MDASQMNRSKHLPAVTSINTLLLFIFILFVVLFLGAAYIFKQQQSQKHTSNIGQTQPSPTPADSISSQSAIRKVTATSNVYTNHIYKFSITYPNTLVISESSFSPLIERVEFWQKNPGSTDQAEYQMLLFPKTIATSAGQDFNSLYKLPPNAPKTIKDNSGVTQKFIKLQNTVFQGENSFTYQSSSVPPDPKEEPETGAYIDLGTNIMIFSTGQSKQQSLKNILNTLVYPTK